MLLQLMRRVIGRSNIAAPVTMDRLLREIAVFNPQPVKSACIKTRSDSPVGIFVKRTSNIVPETME